MFSEMFFEMGGSSRTQSSSRWNPTKEQISMLESLYKQGIRTPSAEQIQEITASLRAYGHIEGKNVFYWFQNHKARQRQKQKQETIAYINHFLHGSQPIFSSPLCPNALCSPIYLPQSEIGFDPQHSKVLPQGGIRRSPTEIFMPMPRNCDGPQVYEHVQHRIPENYINSTNQETLALFPLHPTGILESKTMDQVSSLASVSADDSTTTPSDFSDIDEEDDRPGNQPFFDFFFVRTRAPRD